MNIAQIENKDIPTIIRLLEELYLELGEEKESITYLNETLLKQVTSNERTMIFKVSIEEHKIIGFMTLTESQAIYAGGDFGVIDEMFVMPEFRRNKIGKRLIQKAQFIGKVKGWNRIDVTAPTEDNEKSRKFYEDIGFVFTGPKLKIQI